MMVVLPRVDQWKAGVFLFSEAQCFLRLGVLKAVSRDKHYAMLQKLRLPNLPFLSLQSIDPLAELSVPCAVHNMPSTENSWKNATFLERNLISLKIFLPPMHLPIFPRSPQAGSKQPPVFTVTHVESHKHRSQSVSVRWKWGQVTEPLYPSHQHSQQHDLGGLPMQDLYLSLSWWLTAATRSSLGQSTGRESVGNAVSWDKLQSAPGNVLVFTPL